VSVELIGLEARVNQATLSSDSLEDQQLLDLAAPSQLPGVV
jgi:hypothetical protein